MPLDSEIKKRAILPFTGLGIFILIFSGLTIWLLFPKSVAAQQPSPGSNCATCHYDRERLATLTEQPDKVYVDPAQYAQEAHGGLDCTNCHGGDPLAATPEEACLEGKAFKNPAATEVVSRTCGKCHADITARSLNSIHTSLDGIHLSLVDLLGEKDGTFKFEATCNACHTTCSSCHMEDPDRRNMLWPRVTSHRFEAKSNSQVCTACHAGMGDTFFGTTGASKHDPSMMAQAGMECVDCHGDIEVHGTGTKTSFSMESEKPTCAECHLEPVARLTSAKDTLVAPQYSLETPAHQIHSDAKLACEGCHTEWYPSCWNCHDGRTDKTVEELYLAKSPITDKVSPAAHSPATSGESGPIPTSMGGGWAIKSRHSWGASHSCETCHTDPDVYILGKEREAPFVGYWTEKRANAQFVDEQLAQTLLIDKEQLMASAHRDQSCADCHQTLTDTVCADCHSKTDKTGTTYLSAEQDWSRTNYVKAKANLDESQALIERAHTSGVNVTTWQQEWDELRADYLQVGQAFHANPGQAQEQAVALSVKSQAFLDNAKTTVQSSPLEQKWLPAGLLVLMGTVGAAALVLLARKQAGG